MTPSKLLTDEEIARKFGIKVTDPFFAEAKALNDTRPDTTICEVPMLQCPHCGREFQWGAYDDGSVADEIACPRCERVIYVVDEVTRIFVTLTTEEPT